MSKSGVTRKIHSEVQTRNKIAESLIVGFGRSGRTLHLGALNELGILPEYHRCIAADPCDPQGVEEVPLYSDLKSAWRKLNIAHEAVCHVAAPPTVHSQVVNELLELGAKRLVVEKPLTLCADETKDLIRRVRAAGATLIPVAVWPHSTATHELTRRLPGSGPRKLTFIQSKPRQQRTHKERYHPTAFDIEMPHQVLLALLLEGPVRQITLAKLWGTQIGSRHCPDLGGAQLTLEHANGSVSELISDLRASYRMRRLTVEQDGSEITVDYPTSSAARYSRMWSGPKQIWRGPDRPITQFMDAAYRTFANDRAPLMTDLGVHIEVIEILDAAKELASYSKECKLETESARVASGKSIK